MTPTRGLLEERPKATRRAVTRARLQNVVTEALTIAMRFASFDEYWNPFLGSQGPAGAYVATLSAEDRDHLRLGLSQRLLGDGAGGRIALSARAWAVRGRGP